MYSIKSDSFEGPLDLLLSLIEKEKLDICQISLAKVTSSYLEKISEIDGNPSEMADFLVIAAKLLYLKSRELIPHSKTNEEEAEIEDLELKLLEYQKYKAAAKHLGEILNNGKRAFGKRSKSAQEQLFMPPKNINGELLLSIFNEALSRNNNSKHDTIEIDSPPKISIEDKKVLLRNIIKKSHKTSFKNLLKNANNKVEIIVTFLAILEMMKHKEIRVSQNNNFTDFEIISL